MAAQVSRATRTKSRTVGAQKIGDGGSSAGRSAVRLAGAAEAVAMKLALRDKPKRGPSAPKPALAAARVESAPAGMKADVTDKLVAAAPAFGEVLKSLARSAAMVQAALDAAAITSLKDLAKETVDVPVLIEQSIDDDGKPTDTNIVTQKVTLASIIPPSMKQVESMTMRMDLMVSEFNATGGVKFTGTQANASASGGFRSFSASGGISRTGVQAEFGQLTEFSTGSVSMALEITERTGFEIPTPAQYGLGPQLSAVVVSVTQTPLPIVPPATTSSGFNRVVQVAIRVRKTDGQPKLIGGADLNITVPPGITFPTPVSSSPETVTYAFQRSVPTAAEPYIARQISVRFGQLTRVISINL